MGGATIVEEEKRKAEKQLERAIVFTLLRAMRNAMDASSSGRSKKKKKKKNKKKRKENR